MLIILAMTLVSKFLRTLAFGRSDSIALEICICAFLYNLLYALATSASLDVFVHRELMRCIVLLMFAFVVAAIHKYNKDLCMAQIERLVEQRRAVLQCTRGVRELGAKESLEETVLDHTPLLARASIDVWYSQFVDKGFFGILKATDKGNVKSFRKKKSLVRWAFADLLNNLGITVTDPQHPEEPVILDDRSFNIANSKQIISMVVFDAMELLSLLVAARVV